MRRPMGFSSAERFNLFFLLVGPLRLGVLFSSRLAFWPFILHYFFEFFTVSFAIPIVEWKERERERVHKKGETKKNRHTDPIAW